MRKTSQEGIQFIKDREGLRLKAYDDGGGVWTIGYGHTKGVKKGHIINTAQAERFLRDDLVEFEDAVDALVKVELTQNQFDALVSFAFNVGVAAFRKSTLLRVLNRGEYGKVPNELSKWVKDNGKVVQGLVKRRALEAAMFMDDAEDAVLTHKPQRATPSIINKENVNWGIGGVAALAAPVAEISNSGEYVQMAIAAIMVAAFGIAAVMFIKRRGA